jgi:YVTN family beta-propeller protein
VTLQLSPDDKVLYVVDRHGKLDFLDAATLKLTGSVPVGVQPQGIAINLDGSEATVGDGKSLSVSIVDLTQRVVRRTVPIGTPSTGAAYVR